MESDSSREMCLRCWKARRTCVCEWIKPFQTSCLVVFLQHPHERRNRVGSARIAHACIENSILKTDLFLDQDPMIWGLLRREDLDCRVVFPGRDSTLITGPVDPQAIESQSRAGSSRRLCLFLLDGTWQTAKQLIRYNPMLASLPRVSFEGDAPSEYGFRRQPRPECLSTLEATYRLLELLEPAPQHETLMVCFRTMVKTQIAFRETHAHREAHA